MINKFAIIFLNFILILLIRLMLCQVTLMDEWMHSKKLLKRYKIDRTATSLTQLPSLSLQIEFLLVQCVISRS
ncbi:hypothetical protein CSQ91_21090 [Janthinobacterium sp. BJB301]|nr:hypothetical protein CSQ91_21090 [Janthinobacterium sp. BJB301]